MELWTGCVAGALEEREFIDLLAEAGFENPSIEPTRVYTREDAAALLAGHGPRRALADEVEGKIMSGFVRATKPGVARAAEARSPLDGDSAPQPRRRAPAAATTLLHLTIA